jgi:hypothetical protein
MYTYIIKTVDLYKIGRAVDPHKRIQSFECGNPYIEIVKIMKGNHESYLHRKFSDKRVKGEWFRLTDEDIATIQEKPRTTKVLVGTIDSISDYMKKSCTDKGVLNVSPIVKDEIAEACGVTYKEITDVVEHMKSNKVIWPISSRMYRWV